MSVYYVLLSFFVYGFFGWCTEVAYAAVKQRQFVNRGFLNGPICPIYGLGVATVVLCLNQYRGNLLLLYVASVVLVTVLEGLTGWLMEKIFHARWWDYTKQPLNIGGYVCLLFSLIWGVACVIIVDFIHPIILKILMFMPHIAGSVFLAVFILVILIDVYVTAASIFRMNRRLAKMDDIAEELRRMSDEIGENIYSSVMEALEKQEVLKLKSKEMTEEMQLHAEELKQRYQDLSAIVQKKHKRLLKAFPKLDSSIHREVLNRLKDRINQRKI